MVGLLVNFDPRGISEEEQTVQPRVCSATGPRKLQACRVPVWSVTSTSRSKEVQVASGRSPPGHSGLLQRCSSCCTRKRHLALGGRAGQRKVAGTVMHSGIVWGSELEYQRVLTTLDTDESRSSLETKP